MNDPTSQTNADDNPNMSSPRAAFLKRLNEVATTDWMAVLREGNQPS
jgi:hypothetical protein